jgi:hypothetical protein
MEGLPDREVRADRPRLRRREGEPAGWEGEGLGSPARVHPSRIWFSLEEARSRLPQLFSPEQPSPARRTPSSPEAAPYSSEGERCSFRLVTAVTGRNGFRLVPGRCTLTEVYDISKDTGIPVSGPAFAMLGPHTATTPETALPRRRS